MDAQQFLAELGHLANAPGGVAKLREMILSLAFKGDLCAHSAESVDVLLKEIERQRLVFNGETRKQRLTRQSAEAGAVVGPYKIPEHWIWMSLSTVGHTWGQKKPDDSFVYIDVSSIDNKAGVVGKNTEVVSANAAPSRARKIVKKGTVLYSTVRPYLLNIAIIERDFEFKPIASTAFSIVHPWEGISARYLYFYLRSPIFVRYVETVQMGMAYPAISDEKFYAGVVPLPPLEEQSRIVAKVDELMVLCDSLEAQQQKRRKLQNKLRQSTLQAVAAADSRRELQTAWSRLSDNFSRLFNAPEDVADLRTMIAELAVRGALDALGEHADSTTVDEYLSELANKKTGKRFAKAAQIDQDILLPNGWRWVLMEDLLSGSESGWSPQCDAEPRRLGEWGVLRVSEVIGPMPQIAPKKHPASVLWQGGKRCCGRPEWQWCILPAG